MKANSVFQVTLLLSYLLLTIGGKVRKSINSGEKTNESLTSPQVNSTIQAQDGEIYDCVDVNLQTTFKHPMFKDHKIQMEPSSFPKGLDIKSPLEGAVLQAQLSTIDCPIGTIPILHSNNMDNTMVQRIGELASNDSRMLGAGIEYWDEVYGIRGSINVYDPKVKKDSQDLSASWIQISSLPKAAVGVGIGAGSCVSPSLSGDNFARFHIFWASHVMGQQESMMDHDNEELNKGCADHNCPGFVQVSHNVGLGGRIHPISIYNGPQYVINVLIFKDSKTENWWLAYSSNNTPIGYWPSSQFSYIKAKGDYAFWGGYVQGPTAASNPPQMGNKNNELVTPNVRDSDPFSSDPKLYSYDGYGLNDNGEKSSNPLTMEKYSQILTTLQVNKTIQMEPSSFPIRMDIKSPLVGAVSQAQLSTIDCTIGTIPIVRNNNLANMMVQRIGWPMLGAEIEYWDEIYGIHASINVYEPSVKKDSKDVSASWIQISVIPKGTNGIGIDARSCVYPSSGDNFARFHIRWDNEELNKSCSDHNYHGFMQVSHSVGLGGRINPISVYNGPQYVINVLIFKTKNWWLAYGSNNTPIRYWPSSQFSYLKAKGDYAFWGGYVQGPTATSNPPQMGSGHFASEGFGKAVFIRNIQVIEDKDNKLVTPNIRNANPFSYNLKLYSYDGYGLNEDGMHVYYGGPGKYI
uniref:Neprosin PEP catalytic domain-containing protein n=1 Tax=Oryza punctata TaxID=4537 RepID=A0A0E0K6A1_ORYPU